MVSLLPLEAVEREAAENIDYINLGSATLSLDTTFKVIQMCLDEELKMIAACDAKFGPVSLRSKMLKDFLFKLEVSHSSIVANLAPLQKELFLLYQICNGLDRYNTQVLKLSYVEFRAKIYYPNITYLLVRFLPHSRKFLQSLVREVYNEVNRKSSQIVNLFINNFSVDQDLIRHDALYTFLGNNIKKTNPLEVRDMRAFYRSVFRNILYYYFKFERGHTSSLATLETIEVSLLDHSHVPTRLSLYRDVLYNLQNEKFVQASPTLCQLGYNYQIFRNVIMDNEFQSVYHSVCKDTFVDDRQYKIMKLYSDDIMASQEFVEKLKKIPTIYRLLKCVRIVSPKSKPYNDNVIKPDVVKAAVLEELVHPFRNIISETSIVSILGNIAENFSNSILSGEYINLLTLSSVYINQISFISQIRKFIRLCLDDIVSDSKFSGEDCRE